MANVNYLFKTDSKYTAGQWLGKVLWMAVKVLAALQLQFLIVIALFSLLFNWVHPPVTNLMLYRAVTRHDPIKPVRWVPIDSIPKKFQRMIIWLEDGRFYRHHGLDFQAIREAMEENRIEGRRVAGASTISQQLARTLFLIPTKSYLRKGLEAEIALEMEHFMTKQRILELYINTIEWGPGIFGFKNASYYHYGKAPSSLSQQQLIKLAAIIASPLRYNTENFLRRAVLRDRYNYLVGRLVSGDTNTDVATPLRLTSGGSGDYDAPPPNIVFIEQVPRYYSDPARQRQDRNPNLDGGEDLPEEPVLDDPASQQDYDETGGDGY